MLKPFSVMARWISLLAHPHLSALGILMKPVVDCAHSLHHLRALSMAPGVLGPACEAHVLAGEFKVEDVQIACHAHQCACQCDGHLQAPAAEVPAQEASGILVTTHPGVIQDAVTTSGERLTAAPLFRAHRWLQGAFNRLIGCRYRLGVAKGVHGLLRR